MSRQDRRRARILRDIDTAMSGIEIAPWMRPLAPRALGYNVRALDVFDRATLLEKAKADQTFAPSDMAGLEDVDFVGSATEIAALVPKQQHGTVDYIVSSHNFEHLPNPIKFLQGCASVLRADGLLVMVVPDRRACFDYFRANTRIGEWLDAFHEDRARPSRRQCFDMRTDFAVFPEGGGNGGAFFVGASLGQIHLVGDVRGAYAEWYQSPPDTEYTDTHCTVMTPASLELMLLEACQLGLIGFEIDEITVPRGAEFVVRLRNRTDAAALSAEAYLARRDALMRRMFQEYKEQISPPLKRRLRSALRPLARRLRRAGRRLRGVPAR